MPRPTTAPPGTGDLTTEASNARFSLRTEAWLYIDGVDVEAPASTGAIVAFGDSITDGFVASTPVSLPVSLQSQTRTAGIPTTCNAGSTPQMSRFRL